VVAAATTSPGRANWSPWKPSRSQSGVHSYVHLPLSWCVCSIPLGTLHPHKLAPSLALASPERFSPSVALSLCTYSSFPLFFSISLDFRCSLAAPSPFSRLPFYLSFICFRCLLRAHDLVESRRGSHLSHCARLILSLDLEIM
jgi:hypothetical protein